MLIVHCDLFQYIKITRLTSRQQPLSCQILFYILQDSLYKHKLVLPHHTKYIQAGAHQKFSNNRVTVELLPHAERQYTLSIITSQLHCFQLRTTLNGKDFKFFSHGLCTEKQNILLQHMHEKKFWILINTYGNNLIIMTWSLVFVLKLVSTFIVKIKNYFSCMC